MPDKPVLQDPDQLVQPLDAEVRVLVVPEVRVAVVEEQHRRGARGVAGRHVVEAVADLAVR